MGWRWGIDARKTTRQDRIIHRAIEPSTSQRSWRQNVAQGKRSGTKWSGAPPWVVAK